jgi:hypothetical protein
VIWCSNFIARIIFIKRGIALQPPRKRPGSETEEGDV